MSTTRGFDRRRFLRGLGVCAALPVFESLAPRPLLAASPALPGTTANGSPLRMAFFYIPNGVNVECWKPTGEGAGFQFGPTLQPLAEFKHDLQVISGLEHKNGFSGGDGGGDHARANSTILTGARPKKTAGADIRLGISVDQVAAKHLNTATRFPSLELSCEGVRKSGACDSGYSCAYQFNIAWRSPTSPVAPEANPRLVFERLFGSGSGAGRQEAFRERLAQHRSILDFAGDQARQLNRELGRNDRQKLDEYLTGVREIERRIEGTQQFGDLPEIDLPEPAGIPASYREHMRLMSDLLVLAFQTDSTRVATFLLAHDGSNRTFEEIGVTDGHHSLSHHQNDPKKLAKIAKIDAFYAQQFAYFVGKMRAAKDHDGRSLLENSMVVYASGLSDGNRHRHDNLPVVLAGHGGGRLQAGRHLQLQQSTPMSNLYVGMLNTAGIAVETFGDSDGRLAI